ncbi:MAG TPA: cytochrome c biogenesis protein CcsA [Candidatus Limnocylindria bacterium]|nr:cytochrome c biogenesis protein CcsA [Candidatus Limnocylindria bacterium]
MISLDAVLPVVALVTLVASAGVGIAAILVRPAVPSTSQGPELADSSPPGMARVAAGGLVVALGILTLALVTRTVVTGHAPWSNLHEFSLAFAAALIAAFLVLGRSDAAGALAPLAATLAAGVLAVGLGLDSRVDALVPALQQPVLLTVHVGSAVLAYAIAGVAVLAAVAELAQRASGGRIRALPTAAGARALGHRAVLIGFPVLTLAIALGSVWANLAWRSYWSNDPKELAAAATWLVFGAYLHVAGRRDRWERLAPWLIVAGFAGVLFTYLVAGLVIVGEHSYGVP